MVSTTLYDSIHSLDSAYAESLSKQNDETQSNSFHSTFIDKLKRVANVVKCATVKASGLGRSTLNFLHTNFVKQFNSVFNLFKSNESNSTNTEKAPLQRHPAVDAKEVKTFINKEVENLKITVQGEKDSKYAEQTIDSILASVYSEQKDTFCMQQVTLNREIPKDYLREIGEAAKECGLTGTEDANGIFKPAGAGANPFLTAILSPLTKRYAHRMLNRGQSSLFKNYAKDKIYQEVGKLCHLQERVTPQDFNVQLENIAKKYLPTTTA